MLSVLVALLVAAPARADNDALWQAFLAKREGVQVAGAGTVTRVLKDDTRSRRHQRFILELDHDQTVLIAHNIDLAPRVEGLERGDRVEFYGEYAWNARGGVVHWTHRDPGRRHINGYLIVDGQRYW
nr:DUF3465 domain-containing protein [Larsenimonas suaedae]